MKISEQEAALITYIRTLTFEDMLDACGAISNESREARRNGLEKAYEGASPVNVGGWIDRSENLYKLQELLGFANDDYRKHVDPEVISEPEVLQ
nr:hypothetical protein [Paenibacillus xylanexedens]